MRKEISLFQIGESKYDLIKIDPRTKFFILILGNIIIFITPSLQFEIIFVLFIMIFGLLCGVYRFSIKIFVAYLCLIGIQTLSLMYLTNIFQIMIVQMIIATRKLISCAMLAGILISSTKPSEFLAAMSRLHITKRIVIPLTIMLRYFPTFLEDWKYIS
jgi:energy-coupling factor transport system permease protein